MWRNLIELGREESPDGKCSCQTNDQAEDDRSSFPAVRPNQHIHRLRAQRHAHTYLAGALFDHVSDSAIDPNTARSKAIPAKTPSNRHRHSSGHRAIAHNAYRVCSVARSAVHRRLLFKASTNNPGGRLRLGCTAHEQIQKRIDCVAPKVDKIRRRSPWQVVVTGRRRPRPQLPLARPLPLSVPKSMLVSQSGSHSGKVFSQSSCLKLQLMAESTLSCWLKSRPERSGMLSVRK